MTTADTLTIACSEAFWAEIVAMECDTVTDDCSAEWQEFARCWREDVTGKTRRRVPFTRDAAKHAVNSAGAFYQHRDIWLDNYCTSWIKLANRIIDEIEAKWPGLHEGIMADDKAEILGSVGSKQAAVEVWTLKPGAAFVAEYNPEIRGTLLSVSEGSVRVKLSRPKSRDFETSDGKQVHFGTTHEEISWSRLVPVLPQVAR